MPSAKDRTTGRGRGRSMSNSASSVSSAIFIVSTHDLQKDAHFSAQDLPPLPLSL